MRSEVPCLPRCADARQGDKGPSAIADPIENDAFILSEATETTNHLTFLLGDRK
jgi:hypothetical protein